MDALRFDRAAKHDKCYGVILGDPVGGKFALFETHDCGENWERMKVLPDALPGEGVFAASNSAATFRGVADFSFVTGGSSRWRFIQRCPRGEGACFDGWLDIDLPPQRSSDSAGAFSVGWAKGVGLVVVGGDYQRPDQCAAPCAWRLHSQFQVGFPPADTQPHGYRSAVACDDESTACIAVGPNGTDVTSDFGYSWHAVKPAKDDAADADRGWNALSLPFVVGANGRIGRLRTGVLKKLTIFLPGPI